MPVPRPHGWASRADDHSGNRTERKEGKKEGIGGGGGRGRRAIVAQNDCLAAKRVVETAKSVAALDGFPFNFKPQKYLAGSSDRAVYKRRSQIVYEKFFYCYLDAEVSALIE